MALPHNEWLHLAQALAVGQSKRTYHNEETRANLSVENLSDRWCAYCHRCHEGGVVMKEHVLLGQEVLVQERRMGWPDDALPVGADPMMYGAALRQCISKGIDLGVMLPGTPLMTSKKHRRLLIGTGQGWIGRGIGNVQPKWVAYFGQHGTQTFATHVEDTDLRGKTVILTEDFFSAMKVRWSIARKNCIAVACLGTRPSNKLLVELLKAHKVVVMFDGDAAGRSGADSTRTRLRGLGVDTSLVSVPEGLDPKDMQAQAIRQLLEVT